MTLKFCMWLTGIKRIYFTLRYNYIMSLYRAEYVREQNKDERISV